MRYVHRRSAKVAHKTLEPYSIPLHLASIVNVIAGVHELPRMYLPDRFSLPFAPYKNSEAAHG